jgi:hypothetical protein
LPWKEGCSGSTCQSSVGPREHCLISSSLSLNYGGVCLASDAQFSDFLGSMGPAQFVGRQTLATTPMGKCSEACSKWTGAEVPPEAHMSPFFPIACWLHALSTQPRAWYTLPSRWQSSGPGMRVGSGFVWAGSLVRGSSLLSVEELVPACTSEPFPSLISRSSCRGCGDWLAGAQRSAGSGHHPGSRTDSQARL